MEDWIDFWVPFNSSKKELQHRYLFLPTDLCQFALENKFVAPFQLYVLLKANCHGKIRLTEAKKKKFAKMIEYESARAITNNIKILRKRNWIGYNKKSGYYFIRSFSAIKNIEKLKFKSAAEFKVGDIRSFKAFIISAVIGKLIRYKIWQRRVRERHSGRSSQRSRRRQYFHEVANTGLAKILGVSISTAYEYKRLAERAGFIEIKKSFKEIRVHRKPFDQKNINAIKKNLPDIANRLRKRENGIYEQQIDKVLFKVRIKRKRYSLSFNR